MKEDSLLTVASLLSILLGLIHLADDVARGMAPGGQTNYVAVVYGVIWLYAALVLTGRRSGYIIILLTAFVSFGIPFVHMRGAGVGFGTNRSGGIFFVWTLLALGVTAMFSMILAARGLWRLRKRQTL
jgi:hypothetical protein